LAVFDGVRGLTPLAVFDGVRGLTPLAVFDGVRGLPPLAACWTPARRTLVRARCLTTVESTGLVA
jgi:hypothetical protein